jgi:hypothetical protein
MQMKPECNGSFKDKTHDELQVLLVNDVKLPLFPEKQEFPPFIDNGQPVLGPIRDTPVNLDILRRLLRVYDFKLVRVKSAKLCLTEGKQVVITIRSDALVAMLLESYFLNATDSNIITYFS